MISTAIAIQDACGNAVIDFSTLFKAKQIGSHSETMTEDEFAEAMFEYSAHLASLTATLVTSACLTKSQMDEMINTIKEMDELGKEAL